MPPARPPLDPPDPDEVAAAQAREDSLEAESVEEARATFRPRAASPVAEAGAPPPVVAGDEVSAEVREAEDALIARAAQMRSAYPDLSQDEILEALKEARAEIEEKRKAAMIKRIMAEERARLRREEGLAVGVRELDEIVEITVDIQDWQNPIRLNMMEYHNGGTYPMPRHVANQIAEMAQWGRRLQRELDGKDSLTEFYRKSSASKINAVGKVVRAA